MCVCFLSCMNFVHDLFVKLQVNFHILKPDITSRQAIDMNDILWICLGVIGSYYLSDGPDVWHYKETDINRCQAGPVEPLSGHKQFVHDINVAKQENLQSQCVNKAVNF